MNPSEICPQRDVFVSFLSGQLTDEQLQRVESHLSKCSACGDTVRALNVNDTFVGMVEKHQVHVFTDEDESDVELRKLIGKLESLAGSPTEVTNQDQLQACFVCFLKRSPLFCGVSLLVNTLC